MASSQLQSSVPPLGVHERARPAVLLILAIVALLILPFSGKAFHIDDPFYVRIAQNILQQPFDPYNFEYNWFGAAQPVDAIVLNPPLIPYYMALVGLLFGWSERALHLGFFPFAALSALGIYCLAKYLTARPFFATLCAVLTPVFLISSTTLMLDMPMIACSVWAVHFWIRGINDSRRVCLMSASVLLTINLTIKYISVTTLLLLLAYTLCKRVHFKKWFPYLGLPLIFLGIYAVAYAQLYGSSPFASATSFSLGARFHEFDPVQSLLVGLAFCGGGLLLVPILTPWLWSKRAVLGWLVYAVLLALVIKLLMPVEFHANTPKAGYDQAFELAFYVTGGTQILVLALLDPLRNRDPEGLLLALWVGGIFVFASFFSWSVNGRTVLIAAAPAGILLARKLVSRAGAERRKILFYGPLLISALLGTVLNTADYRLAASAKEAAHTLSERIPRDGRSIWFSAHWGFQHYMESLGATALDTERSSLRDGDVIIVSDNNTNMNIPEEWEKHLKLADRFSLPSFRWATTTHSKANAGFYSSVLGPLPFTFKKAPDEAYYALMVLPKKGRVPWQDRAR